LVQGLKAAGSNPTQASVISAMQQIHNYNGAGLYGTHSVSFALATRRPTPRRPGYAPPDTTESIGDEAMASPMIDFPPSMLI
jgi:hypothetical protein